MDANLKNEIETIINENQVVLFMKGTSKMPQVVSQGVAGILNFLQFEYKDVNVLENDSIRQGIKDFSDWPRFLSYM